MPLLCIVCSTGEAKYKCPSCQSPYCSIPCYKAHQETHSANAEEKVAAAATTQDAPSLSQPPLEETQKQQQQISTQQATVSNSLLHLNQPVDFSPLDSSPDLGLLLTRYPLLRAQLQKIYAAMREPSPDDLSDDDEPAGGGRGNTNNSGRGRGRGNQGSGSSDRRHWTPEKRTREALFVLTRAREAQQGGQAEGLEEFKRLVLRLCVERDDAATAAATVGRGEPDEIRADGEADAVAAFLNGLG